MEHPDFSAYKDVNKDSPIPKVQVTSIKRFLENFDAELQAKVKAMYKDKFLSYVRYAQDRDKFYIHACCHSEMKKSAAYYVDIILDHLGVPKETQCDCGAGKPMNVYIMKISNHVKHLKLL